MPTRRESLGRLWLPLGRHPAHAEKGKGARRTEVFFSNVFSLLEKRAKMGGREWGLLTSSNLDQHGELLSTAAILAIFR